MTDNRGSVAEVQVQYLDPIPQLTPSDLTELGALLSATGLTQVHARGLIAKVQQGAAQTALALAPAILEEVRKVQAARLLEVINRIRLLPNVMGMGYVNRDRVLQIVQDVFSKTPSV